MNGTEIISLHGKVGDMHDDGMDIISAMYDSRDMEVSAVICGWLSNGSPLDACAMKDVLYNVMDGKPYLYVSSGTFGGDNRVMHGMLTERHFRTLMAKMHDCYDAFGTLGTAIRESLGKSRRMYVHTAIATILGGGTMLPTPAAMETFYRYNLMCYWLCHCSSVWGDIPLERAVLPCNDRIFRRAFDLGIVSHRMKSSLDNAVMLTKKARGVFGDAGFYKMYELLNSDVV